MIDKKKYVELWDNDKHRRNRARLLLEVHDNQWKDQLVDKIKLNFAPENRDRILSKLDMSQNMMRWASDTLAPIYSDGVHREIEGQKEADLELYENGDLTNMTLDRAARLCFSVREVLLRPIVNEETGKVILDVLTPDRCSVIRHPDNPLRLIGLVYQTENGDIVVWEEDDHKVYNRSWAERFRENGEPYSNDYGMIPFVLCHASFPDRGTWHEGDAEGLRQATLNLGMAKTDYNHKRHLQSHKQIVITGVKSKGIGKKANQDAGYALVFQDPQADAKILDLQGDLNSHLDSIIQDAAQTLRLYGISPSAVRGNMDASSGYALSIKMTDTERVWKQQRQLWQVWEQMLYAIARRVVEVDGSGQLPEGKLSFVWPDIGPKQDKNEEADYWLKLLNAGVTNVPEVRRNLFGDSEDQIEEFMQETEEYTQRTSPIAPPVLPNPFTPNPQEDVEA